MWVRGLSTMLNVAQQKPSEFHLATTTTTRQRDRQTRTINKTVAGQVFFLSIILLCALTGFAETRGSVEARGIAVATGGATSTFLLRLQPAAIGERAGRTFCWLRTSSIL